MASKQKLDLRDVEWPISILKCNEEIDGLQPGEALDVFVAHMGAYGCCRKPFPDSCQQGDIRFEMVQKSNYCEVLIQKKGGRPKKKPTKGQINSTIRPPTVKGDI